MEELPKTNVKKNFPGTKKGQYYSLAELQSGDYAGMTESDAHTSGKNDGQYTKINKTKGKKHNG